MPRWFAVDSIGQLAVCTAEHIAPEGSPTDDDVIDLTIELSRWLRRENRPVRGVHAHVRAGELQMITSAAGLRTYASHVQPLTDGVVVARFAPPPRGRAASFMPGVRSFGTGESESPSDLERAHAKALCDGCAIDRAGDDIDEERLQALGLYVYQCDEEQERLERCLVPEDPLAVTRIGELRKRCFKYGGEFARAAEFPMRELTWPRRR